MAETKDDIAAERDELRAENERLRAELARAGTAVAGYRPSQTFQLSEGDRQELAIRGVLAVGGRLLTREQVREILPEGQRDLDLGTAEPDEQTLAAARRTTAGVPGVDFVYPSVAPGQIDPAVAGTPGISGPAADATPDHLSEGL